MNKTALVTGASQGLGLCLCRELIASGYSVFALDLRIGDELKSLASDKFKIIECDVSNGVSVENAKSQVSVESLDIIFNQCRNLA